MKETFILKTKYGSVINKLSDKQAGILFKMLFEYVENGVNAGSKDDKIDMALEFIKLDLEAFNKSYEKRITANRENGKKGGEYGKLGGRPAKTITPKNPQKPPITPDNDNVFDNEIKEKLSIESKKKHPPKEEQATKIVAAKAATLSRKDNFYNSLIPFVEQYGKEMVRDFFSYWSELDKPQTRMRFELQKTWETSMRLATWNKNQKFNGTDKQQGISTAKQRELETDRDVAEFIQKAFSDCIEGN